MGLEIRECCAADLPAVRYLLQQLGENTHSAPAGEFARLEDTYRAMAEAPDVYLNLIAVADGQVAGLISLVFYKTLFHAGGTALINELVVDLPWRGRGLGRALIERARAEAQHRGLDEIEVSTERDNQAARAFYHRCGFDEEYVLLGAEFDAGTQPP